MKKITITFILLGIYFFANAQKEDYNWVLGNASSNKNLIQFSESSYSIDTFYSTAWYIHITNSSISDSLGNFLFYTNGTNIYNLQGIINNGDSINIGYLNEFYGYDGFYTLTNALLFLPSFEKNYFLFHLRGDSVNTGNPQIDNDGAVENLLYSKIEFNENSEPFVSNKNTILVNDTLVNCGVSACKHGNGRDWWLIVGEAYNNCYYTILMTPDSVFQVSRNCLGVKNHWIDGGQSLFSLDGSKYIRGSSVDGVEIFDFDRCSGLLSNPKHIPRSMLEVSVNNGFIGSVSVSPNNRFLYVISDAKIRQFDLEASDLVASQIIIHNRDTADLQNYVFVTSQIAPNGEIIVSNSDQPKFHIIHNPDELGAACNFERSIPLLTNGSFGLPNFPNFRLGPLTGSACDTLGVGIQEIKESFGFLVKPNPASTYVEIDYGNFPWQSSSQASLHIYNLLGELVYSQNLPQYSGKRILDIQNFASGVYVLQINDNGNLVGTEKLVVYR
jgi:hypothetical protein